MKPFGKVVLGLFLGVLLAVVAIGGLYYFAVMAPQQKAFAAATAEQLDRDLRADNADLQRRNDAAEGGLKAADPGNPCNRLSGAAFADCLQTGESKHRPGPRSIKANRPAAAGVESAESDPIPVSAAAVPALKFSECVNRPASMSIDECETRLDRSSYESTASACRQMPYSAAYRECLVDEWNRE